MKVCLLNDSFPPVIDGTVNVVMNYAKYMMEDYGAQVIVGTPRYPEADYDQYPYPVVAYHSLGTATVTNGYRTGNPFDDKKVWRLASFQPDVIHSHCPASATLIARILRKQTGAPVIFTYHTKYDIDIRRAVKAIPIANEGIKAMVKNIEGCDDIWVVSKGAGESLKALGFSGDYTVMGNGVDFAKGKASDELVRKATQGYDLPDGVPLFLYVGRLMTYKNLPMILDAMKLLDEKGVDFRMVFVGKGPDRKLLEERAKELGLMGTEGRMDKCIFTGAVYERDLLRAWNTRADVFIFPSTFDTNGLVVREAAACGLASILIRDSCAAEGVTDGRNGFLIEENAEAMAEVLSRLAADLSHVHQVGQHAMDEIYQSWKECVGMAMERYRFILEEKKAGRLEEKKKDALDYLVSATAKGMEEQEKIRSLGKEMFDDFRESAVGMMENIQEAEDRTEQFLDTLTGTLRSEIGKHERVSKLYHKLKDSEKSLWKK